jgi:hypothetical protein
MYHLSSSATSPIQIRLSEPRGTIERIKDKQELSQAGFTPLTPVFEIIKNKLILGNKFAIST